MISADDGRSHRERPYERVCKSLARGRNERPRARDTRPCEADLSCHLRQARLELGPHCVTAAARAAFWSVLSVFLILSATLFAVAGLRYALVSAFAAVMCSLIAREAILSYPRAAAQKRAWKVLRSSTEGVNMMIVSLRHEPSLPSAMRSAATMASEFGEEVRESIWGVVMGVHSTFEEALLALGTRWGDQSRDLKAAMHALITASCEGSEDGRRSALDRASNRIVASTRRRIEDYALGLALPSTMLFSIGVLLPLMVGSFLPMMSWDIWTAVESTPAPPHADISDSTMLRTVIVMNILFPVIAVVIATDAASRHPTLSDAGEKENPRPSLRAVALACALAGGAVGLVGSGMLLASTERPLGFILSAAVPAACYLMVVGEHRVGARGDIGGTPAEDVLFSLGARLMDGDNLEHAVRRTAGGRFIASAPKGIDDDCLPWAPDASVVEAARVVVRAAAKDEAQAGMLAMDLSRYIRDLSELDLTLRRRLRPTVSMMRLTSHVLAPLMLGITYAIYLSLASIGDQNSLQPGALLLVLGTFLVEMNAVVAYFVWGIGERRSLGELEHSIGSCVLVATLVYSATVLVVS